MPLDALTTRTGLVLGAASLLLAISAFGLTIAAKPRVATSVPDYDCVLPAADPVVHIAQPDPLAGLPQECSLYIASLRQLAQSSCPVLPADARKSILQAADQMEQTWQTMPTEAIDALTGACREGQHAMRQALTQLCPQQITR